MPVALLQSNDVTVTGKILGLLGVFTCHDTITGGREDGEELPCPSHLGYEQPLPDLRDKKDPPSSHLPVMVFQASRV